MIRERVGDGVLAVLFVAAMVAVIGGGLAHIWIGSDLGWHGWLLTAAAAGFVAHGGSGMLGNAARNVRERAIPEEPIHYYAHEGRAGAIVSADHVLQIRRVLPDAEAFPLLATVR